MDTIGHLIFEMIRLEEVILKIHNIPYRKTMTCIQRIFNDKITFKHILLSSCGVKKKGDN